MNMRLSPAWLLIAATMAAGSLLSCTNDQSQQAASQEQAQPGTRAYDMSIWHSLLRDHTKIRRTVRHLPNGVDAVTESDDPDVAARIINHAKAMQTRVASGAQVRGWDPVFSDLFAKHEAIRLEVTPTSKGVRIVETSEDPEVVALLRSHAMGVSEFIRGGFDVAPNQTPRLSPSDPIPANEVALGGVPHRFLLEQPSAEQLAAAKKGGIAMSINFRPAKEQAGFDEASAAASAGLSYCNVPYAGAGEMTDEVLDVARAALASAETSKTPAVLHCRTGNRVGPAWAAYRVLNQGASIETAVAEAKGVGMVDPLLESTLRDYLRRRMAPASTWSAVTREAMTPTQEAQRAKAQAAKDAMFSKLMAALMDAQGGPEGPVGAIGVCKQEAPKIAQAISRDSGVMIGRTSVRRRNPMNTAPAWAKSTIESSAAASSFFANSDGSLGVALPIVLADNCLMCHGDPAAMDPALKDVIAKTYPKDQATGFAVGDLRGWFWVEVPGARKP